MPVRISRRIAGAAEDAEVSISRHGEIGLYGSGVSILDDYDPSFPSLFAQGSDDIIDVPTADAGIQGFDRRLNIHIDGNGQYVKGSSTFLSVTGTPTSAHLIGNEVTISNYAADVEEIYGFSAFVNCEWAADYAYGAMFTVGPGSANADGMQFLCGVSSYAQFGHFANTGQSIAYEAALVSAPSGVPVVADEVAGLYVWGVANANCMVSAAYGVYLRSFAKNGGGSGYGHIYGVHADQAAFDNTSDPWFLHSLSNAPSLLSGELQFAILGVEPPNPPAGRFTVFGLDNGSGKIKAMVKFPTGVAQQLAIEA